MISPREQIIKPTKINRLADPSSKRLIKLALVDAQPKIRETWIKRFNSFPNIAWTCTCVSGEEALQTIPRELPDVVLMDIVLPYMSGIECTVRLKEVLPNIRVVIFTNMNDQKSVFHALKAGADGYLLKQTKPADLRIALLEALSGGVPMTSHIARCVVESFRRQAKIPDESKRLSLREEWILMLVCQGLANSQIANKLDLSINTVCAHLKCVFKKLQVGSRTEAMIRYMASKTPHRTRHTAAKSIVTGLLGLFLATWTALSQPIDRRALVTQHNVVLAAADFHFQDK
jgi:DNA-binding NarL/FixJ family response regulator